MHEIILKIIDIEYCQKHVFALRVQLRVRRMSESKHNEREQHFKKSLVEKEIQRLSFKKSCVILVMIDQTENGIKF